MCICLNFISFFSSYIVFSLKNQESKISPFVHFISKLSSIEFLKFLDKVKTPGFMYLRCIFLLYFFWKQIAKQNSYKFTNNKPNITLVQNTNLTNKWIKQICMFLCWFFSEMHSVKSFEKDRQREKVYRDGSGSDGGRRTALTSWVGRWMISSRLNFLMVYPLGAPPPGLPQSWSIVS